MLSNFVGSSSVKLIRSWCLGEMHPGSYQKMTVFLLKLLDFISHALSCITQVVCTKLKLKKIFLRSSHSSCGKTVDGS